jgi:putative membrane protein
MWDAHEGMAWWMLFAGVWMVLFWGLIIGAVAWLLSRSSGGGERRPSPLDIARERYARGELTREEFEHIREDLRRA